jgi:putative salt-induced outer membrane protein YdiY
MRTPLAPAALLLARAALGQAPAKAPEPAAPPPPPRVEGSAQLTFLDTRGNASSQSLGAGGEVIWRPDPWTYTAKALFAQSESSDSLTARSVSALARASRALGRRLAAYGQYDFLRDRFAGIDERHVAEAGLSYAVVDVPRQRLRLDAGLGYLSEQHPDGRLEGATLTLGAPYRLAISKTSELTYEPRYLLPLSEAEAWKFGQEVTLTAAVSSALALKVAHTLRYSAEPPAGFRTTDTIMTVSLVAKARRPR